MKAFITTLLLILCIGMPGCDSSDNQLQKKSELEETADGVQRFGMVIKVKPEKLAFYREIHAKTWPGVLKQITRSNIRNYSIYLKDDYLFSYFEYVGNDFEKDMAQMKADSTTQAWWKITDPCQAPLETRAEGEWWANMEEVFHHD